MTASKLNGKSAAEVLHAYLGIGIRRFFALTPCVLVAGTLSATEYVWDGASSGQLGDVRVEKTGNQASLTGTKDSWVYAGEASYDALTAVLLQTPVELSSLSVSSGVDFRALAGALDQGSGALPENIAVNHSRIVLQSSPSSGIVSSTSFSGAGGVIAFVGDGSGSIEYGDFEHVFEGFLPTEWARLPNTRLADVTSVTGSFRKTYPSDCYFFENDGSVASAQLQAYATEDYLFGAIIDLKQDGADVLIRLNTGVMSYAPKNNPGYEKPGSYKFRIDQMYPISAKGAEWNGYWLPQDVRITLKSRPGSYTLEPEVELNAQGALTAKSGARFVFGDADGRWLTATINNNLAFSGATSVQVKSNATVVLAKNGADNQSGYGLDGQAWWVLDPGATLVSKGYFSIGAWQGVELGAGAVWTQNSASGTYISNLTYHDGARTVGNVNLGAGTAPLVKVDGASAASEHSGGIAFYTFSPGLKATFDIDDATQSTEPDFVVYGDLKPLVSGSNDDMRLVKRGTGTLRLNGRLLQTRNPFILEAGGIELGLDGSTDASAAFDIQGESTLSLAGGTTNVIGTLDVKANLSIVLGAGSELDITAVADGLVGYPNVQVSILTAADARIRIGTSSAGASQGVMRRFRLDGKKCMLDDAGYVVERPKYGLVLSVR